MPLAGGQLAATRPTVSRDASRPAYLRIPGFIGCNGALDRWTRVARLRKERGGRRAGNTRSRNRAPPYRSSQSEIIPCRRLRARVARKKEEEEEVGRHLSNLRISSVRPFLPFVLVPFPFGRRRKWKVGGGGSVCDQARKKGEREKERANGSRKKVFRCSLARIDFLLLLLHRRHHSLENFTRHASRALR